MIMHLNGCWLVLSFVVESFKVGIYSQELNFQEGAMLKSRLRNITG